MLRMESFSLIAWRHFLHRATDEWTYRLNRTGRKSSQTTCILSWKCKNNIVKNDIFLFS